VPLTLTPLTPLSLSPRRRRGRGHAPTGAGGRGHYPLRRRREGEGSLRFSESRRPAPCATRLLSARLFLLRLAPYFASEPRLRGGGLSEYPFALRSPSEAKYGAKKGISERGSDPLHRGSERGAGGKEGKGASLLAPALSPCPPLHIALLIFPSPKVKAGARLSSGRGHAPVACANPPLTVSLSFREG